MSKLRRSMLFLPGANAAMLSTAFIYRPDSIMFDLEDAVALREKDTARMLVFHALQHPMYQDIETVVRINPLSTPFGLLDLEAAVRAGVDVIRLPKTDTPDDIYELEGHLERIEQACGREVGSTRVMAAIESAIGVINAVAIARSSPRLIGIALAAFDYVMDMQTERGDGTELFYARCAVLHAARAAGIDAFDVVWSDANDEAGFLREVDLIRKMGFNGKSLINPRQIDLLHNAYAPTREEVEHAKRVIEAAEEGERNGLGVVSLNGKWWMHRLLTTRRWCWSARRPPACVGKDDIMNQTELLHMNFPHLRDLKPFDTAHSATPWLADSEAKHSRKLCASIEEAVKRCGLQDGMTISFHHAFREGDRVINTVVALLARMGFKNLTLASSSLMTCNDALIEHIESGVITRIYTSGMRGRLADAISHGLMDEPVQIHSHGGRVKLLQDGELNIDVAFLGVPCSDEFGNANGTHGKSCCGSLGYAMVDAQFARKVVLLTEALVPFPNMPASLVQDQVDYIVQVESVGDPAKISVGAARVTSNPRELMIARYAADVIEHSGYFKPGFSMQTGSGAAATACTRFMEEKMERSGVKARFALGGITGSLVDLHEKGLIEKLLDTQCFDGQAAASLARNPNHVEISTNVYANPGSKAASCDQLDVVILSALEIDVDFNVNVITGSDGVMRGASGGHCDVAAAANLTIVVAPLLRSRIPTVVKRVTTRLTPGESIDVLVTDHGIAVNPARPEIRERLMEAGMKVVDINALYERAISLTGVPKPIEFTDKIVGVIRYRDGSVIDTVRQVKEEV